MKTSALAAILSMSMALGIAAPMFAADSKAPATTTKVQSKPAPVAHTSSTTGADEPLQKAVEGCLVVTRVGGVGCGVVLGTPVAIVRETLKSYTTWTPEIADHIGGKDFAPSMLVASVATVPASLVWGSVAGTYHGCRNGLTHGFTEPFNLQSFSVTKDYEE